MKRYRETNIANRNTQKNYISGKNKRFLSNDYQKRNANYNDRKRFYKLGTASGNLILAKIC